MANSVGPVRRLWYQWKMMHLPWRQKWLVGFDLQGNTFWEFKDALHSNRKRRIVKYSRWTHYGDVNVDPGWMQWLRHTRYDPPSLAEQRADIARQERIKLLAAQADARWAAKESALDKPDQEQQPHLLEPKEPQMASDRVDIEQEMGDRVSTTRSPEPARDTEGTEGGPTTTAPKKFKAKKEPKESPFKSATPSNPGDEWQPESWTPAPAKRRR
ncbi:hypothetical protein BU24DRAFT_404022 [Aaosphaeria arxii CBS 175.79]|uniref:Uncharacterized protein n=1 Tax=Aaosphaeria arxii CBS 175.79 TaxID=1450172 RepID=A0A6A5Y5Y6_9PLEO|nr:uncharacterized protein BU24DRAFT_404022 [Aaosphaeria arxii CBS 175.79]KAF2020962.1 hypothetical protein BU24DRAFT_404022 [Aaosphaeria arxii CBS 175.79]